MTPAEKYFEVIDQHLPMQDSDYCACGATWGAAHLAAALAGDTAEFGVEALQDSEPIEKGQAQTIPYAAGPDETRERAVKLYDDGIRAFNLYPPQDGGNAHHSAVLGVYEVGFLDGIKQAQKEARG